MLPAPERRPWRAGLVLRALVLFLPILGAVWQTSCWVYVDDCDDDDDNDGDDDDDFDCDDHDHDDDDDDDGDLTQDGGGGGSPVAESAGAATLPVADLGLRLRTFELISSDDPAAHPVRRVTGIRGIAFASAAGAAVDERALENFTKLVLFENWDLLGLPASAGRLDFDGIEFPLDEIRVRFLQVEALPLVRLAGFERPPGVMTFVFDRERQLVEIDNTTRIRIE